MKTFNANLIRLVTALAGVSALSGCSIGQNEFNCSSGDGNALCGSSRTVYKATDGDLKENNTLTFIEEGEVRQITIDELNDIKNGGILEKNSTMQKYSTNDVPFSFSYDGEVLRKDVKVMRIWVAPWVDKSDDLHLSTMIYTDIEKRKWEVGTVLPESQTGVKPHLVSSEPESLFGIKQEESKSSKAELLKKKNQ